MPALSCIQRMTSSFRHNNKRKKTPQQVREESRQLHPPVIDIRLLPFVSTISTQRNMNREIYTSHPKKKKKSLHIRYLYSKAHVQDKTIVSSPGWTDWELCSSSSSQYIHNMVCNFLIDTKWQGDVLTLRRKPRLVCREKSREDSCS